jgi:hypothetical protein
LFDPQPTAEDTAKLKVVTTTIANAAYDSVAGIVNTNATAAALERQSNATKNYIYSFTPWSMVFSNNLSE